MTREEYITLQIKYGFRNADGTVYLDTVRGCFFAPIKREGMPVIGHPYDHHNCLPFGREEVKG